MRPPSRVFWRSSPSVTRCHQGRSEMLTTTMTAPKGGTKTLIEIDLNESPYKNEMIHNRWHPDIPIIAWVKPGEDFVVQTYDWTGGFIQNNDSADDVRDI